MKPFAGVQLNDLTQANDTPSETLFPAEPMHKVPSMSGSWLGVTLHLVTGRSRGWPVNDASRLRKGISPSAHPAYGFKMISVDCLKWFTRSHMNQDLPDPINGDRSPTCAIRASFSSVSAWYSSSTFWQQWHGFIVHMWQRGWNATSPRGLVRRGDIRERHNM